MTLPHAADREYMIVVARVRWIWRRYTIHGASIYLMTFFVTRPIPFYLGIRSLNTVF